MPRSPPRNRPIDRKDAPSRLFDDPSEAGEAMDRHLAGGLADRRRREELHGRFRQRLSDEAQARGDDPYRLLAEAIRRMLRD
ncbi:MAG: hypothetical protein RLY86_412 [Pseudomonadota bacterium]